MKPLEHVWWKSRFFADLTVISPAFFDAEEVGSSHCAVINELHQIWSVKEHHTYLFSYKKVSCSQLDFYKIIFV